MKIKAPKWVLNFQHKIIQLEIIAGGRNWYKHPQPYLSVLKKTGQGNCVAWSKLIREIALRANLVPIIIIIGGADKKGDYSRHQFCIIIDDNSTIWYQNCLKLKRFRKMRLPMTSRKLMTIITQIANIVGRETGYKNGIIVHEIIDHPFEA